MTFAPDLLQTPRLQQFLDVFVQAESIFLPFPLEIYWTKPAPFEEKEKCQSPANRIILKSVMFFVYLMQGMGKGWIL